jgi:hypothetical protein
LIDFGRILAELNAAQVEFILVGGAAGIAHGASRLTQDLDVVYRRSRQNAERLAAALAPHSPSLRGAPPGLPFRFDVQTIVQGCNFTLATSLGDIDLLGEITAGGNYDQLLDSTVVLRVFETECRCLDLTTLIRVKRAVGRPKDFEAIAELESMLDEQ